MTCPPSASCCPFFCVIVMLFLCHLLLLLASSDDRPDPTRPHPTLPDPGLPEAGVASPLTGRASPSSSRGKRHCRMLKDLAGTQDGRHVVLVCSDGMLLYHRHTQVDVGVCEISGERGREGGARQVAHFMHVCFCFFSACLCLPVQGALSRGTRLSGRPTSPPPQSPYSFLPGPPNRFRVFSLCCCAKFLVTRRGPV